jgi:hypothetical protein
VRAFWFPDTTVLRNFAVADALQVLQNFLDGRGRWSEAVHYEVEQQSRSLTVLTNVLRDGWLGDPIEVDDPSDIAQIEGMRRAVFGGGSDKPLQHLGEAQTCFLLQRRPEFQDSVWVTDDREAERYAKNQRIRTLNTVELMSEILAREDISRVGAWALLNRMADLDRPVVLPRKPSDL